MQSGRGRQTFGQDYTEAQDIQVLNLQTRQLSVVPGSQAKFSPRWSPDGRFLAALTGDSLFDFKTQKWTDWLTGQNAFGYPTWSRDSKYLYFDSTFSNDRSYRRLKVGESESERIVSLKISVVTSTFLDRGAALPRMALRSLSATPAPRKSTPSTCSSRSNWLRFAQGSS